MPDVLDPLSELTRPSDPNRDALNNPRVRKFLDRIGKSEGADYNTLVGGSRINDLSRHPNKVGLQTSAGPSTAFGKYQIVGITDRSKLAKYRHLDYSPENQDLRAVELLRQTGALEALEQGDEAAAIKRASKEWASLPGSPLPGRKNYAAFKDSVIQDPLTELTQGQAKTPKVDPLTEITSQPPVLTRQPGRFDATAEARPVRRRPHVQAQPPASTRSGLFGRGQVETSGLSGRAAPPTSTRSGKFAVPLDARKVVESTIMDYQPSDTLEAQAGRDVLAQEDTLAGNLKHGFDVFTDPIGTFTKSRGQRLEEAIAQRIEQQKRAQSPEVVAERKDFGSQPAPIRALTMPAGRAGAGIVKMLAGLSSWGGVAPNEASDYLNKRATLLEDAASLPPLNAQGEEIVRGLPEKATGAVLDIGFTVAQLIAMKKATGMSLSSLMATETALKTSDKPMRERAAAVAHAYGMGKILDQHLSRPVSAALFGGPTAVSTGLEYAQGNMSLEDALLQTGVETGAGAILAGGKPKRGVRGNVERGIQAADNQNNSPSVATRTGTLPEASAPKNRTADSQTIQAGVKLANVQPANLRPEAQQPIVVPRRAVTEPPTRGDVRTSEAVEGSRREPLAEVAQEVPPQSGQIDPTTAPPQPRWLHRDFGEVKQSENQAGVGQGKVRVVAEDGVEHVIQKPKGTGAGNQIAIPVRKPAAKPVKEPASVSPIEEGVSKGAPSPAKVEPIRREVKPPAVAPEPSTTSARNEQLAADRAELDLPELPIVERKKWQQTLDEAKAKGSHNASVLADEVLARPRALNDIETAQLVLRAQELKTIHAERMKEIGDATDRDVISTKRSQAEALEREFDRITTATKKSGTEKGRALASQKLTINQDFDLVSVLQRAKAAKGRELNAEERTKYEGMVEKIKALQTKLAKVQSEALNHSIQKDIERVRRQTKRSEKKKELDEEFAFLKTEFAQARMETKGVQASGLAGLDPEGKLTPIILKMARNRVKAGVIEAEKVVDHVYNAVKEHVEDITKEDIRALLAGHNLDRDPLPAIKTRLRRQEADLTRRIEEKDYSVPPPRKPVVYDREASNLKARVEQLKRQIEADIRGNDSKLDVVLAMRKAGMLTGFRTHMRNIGGTAVFQVVEEVNRMPGAIADLLVSTVTKRRTLGMPNPVDVAKSSYAAATKGLREAAQIMKYGATADDLAKLERPRELNSGSKIIDRYVNTVFRTLAAEDKVFRSYALERSLLEQKRLLKTDKVTPEMEAQAILDAEISTFNNQNQLAQGIEWLSRRSGPVGSTAIDLVLPFKRTPANIASRLLESTPLGMARGGGQLLKAAINKEMTFEQQRKFSQTIGRSVTGSSLILLGYWMASKGLATGLPEDDAGDREIQKASGRSPLAVKIGDRWHQIGAFSPIGNLIAIGAALHREQTKPLKEGEERGNIITSAAPVAAKVMLDQPFLKGASGVVDALENPSNRGSALVGQTVSSFVPTLMSDAGAAIDNDRRSGRGVTDRLMSRIPILRRQIPEDVDVFGRPPQSRRTAMVDPTLTSSENKEPFMQELVRLDVGVVKTNKKPGESETQHRERVIAQGKEMAKELANLTATRGYKSAADDDKRKMIKDKIEQVRKAVNEFVETGGVRRRKAREPRGPRQPPYRYAPQ